MSAPWQYGVHHFTNVAEGEKKTTCTTEIFRKVFIGQHKSPQIKTSLRILEDVVALRKLVDLDSGSWLTGIGEGGAA